MTSNFTGIKHFFNFEKIVSGFPTKNPTGFTYFHLGAKLRHKFCIANRLNAYMNNASRLRVLNV